MCSIWKKYDSEDDLTGLFKVEDIKGIPETQLYWEYTTFNRNRQIGHFIMDDKIINTYQRIKVNGEWLEWVKIEG